MHQSASKCMQNELCKGIVHEIDKELVLITSKGVKINEIHLPLYGGTPCIVSYFVRWTFTKEQRKKIRESPKLVCFLGYPMKSVGCDVATTTQSPWGKIQ